MTFKLTIDGVDYTQHLALPVKWNALLDERLDEGRASLRHTKKDLFRIGAEVTLNLGNGDGDIDFIVAEDEAAEIPCGSGYYNHELMLIEPTKILERIPVETLTFTNNLGRTYNLPKIDVEPVITPDLATGLTLNGKVWLQGPLNIGETISIPSTNGLDRPIKTSGIAWPSGGGAKHEVRVYEPSGELIYSDNGTTESKALTIDKLGEYKVVYTYGLSVIGVNGKNYNITYTFLAVDLDKAPLPKWNIRSVIERVLNLAEPHLTSVEPQFKLDPAQAVEFEKIESPEFAFTGLTLKGVLDQIGGFIHGVPRLIRGASGKLDTVHYDMLGETEQALLADPKFDGQCVTLIKTHNIENYATELDSTAENLTNTLDPQEGATIEPYKGGFKTVRSEEQYSRIIDGNMVIETTLPVYSVQKLEVITPDGKVGDITSYVFEGAEYGRLSSFEGNYPTSKAFAIYYSLGKNNIKGLNYKSPTVIGGAGAEYSITNIVKAATGWDISANWWKDGNYPKLAFRITYTPIFSARVLQHKPYIESGALKSALIYNQGANLIETRYYGENLKGTIARMGNPEQVRTYKVSGRPAGTMLIPKVGQMWRDDYFVSAVTCAAHADHVDCTIGLSKDFNRLSQYIGINSEWRAYEVSERRAFKRDMVYRDFVVIGDPVLTDKNKLTNVDSLFYVQNTFLQSDVGLLGKNSAALTVAGVTTTDSLGIEYKVTLPITSAVMGNTLLFNFGMADNYSAGAKSVPDGAGNVSGYWQTDVVYSDYYGRAATLGFTLRPRGEDADFNSNIGFELPQGSHDDKDVTAPVRTNTGIVLDKDGSEIVRMNYQLSYVTNWRDLIIGPAMTRNNPMVSGRKDGHAAKLYILSEKVGRFDTKIDTAAAVSAMDLTDLLTASIDYVYFLPTIPTADGVAWAIADMATGEILLARNTAVKSGEEIQMPYIGFTHSLKGV